jgi:hypothetical protein
LFSIGASLPVVVAEEVRVLVPHVSGFEIAAIARNVNDSKGAHDSFETIVELVADRDD